MAKREQEWAEAALFAIVMLALVFMAGIGFQKISEGENSAFDKLKTASIAWQAKKNGYSTEYLDSGYMAQGVETVGYLLDGLLVEQDFTVTEEMLQYDELGIGIQIGTYSRKNKTNLYVELSQDNGFGKAYKIDCTGLKDNADVIISFPTEQMQAQACHVKLYSDSANINHAVTVYTTKKCVLAPEMRIAGTAEEKNLIMRVFTPS